MRESASGYYNIDESFPVHQQFVRQCRVGEGGWRRETIPQLQIEGRETESESLFHSHTLVRIYLLNNCVVA